MLDYYARYRRYYPSATRKEVWFEIPMQQGYAEIAAAMNIDPWLAFSGVKMVGGYVEQELKKRG